jgi:putative selenate reductase
MDIQAIKMRRGEAGWEARYEGTITIREDHQIANFADLCNDCGNCDVFCPEDGGPYVLKPRFFGSLERWRASSLDGFHVGRGGPGAMIAGRFDGREHGSLPLTDGLLFGPGFSVSYDEAIPGTAEGEFRRDRPDVCADHGRLAEGGARAGRCQLRELRG